MENKEKIDEIVYEYIDRAWKILGKDLFAKNQSSAEVTIEIAKMIQKEEFRNSGVYYHG